MWVFLIPHLRALALPHPAQIPAGGTFVGSTITFLVTLNHSLLNAALE